MQFASGTHGVLNACELYEDAAKAWRQVEVPDVIDGLKDFLFFVSSTS